jgi:hypothetical protein
MPDYESISEDFPWAVDVGRKECVALFLGQFAFRELRVAYEQLTDDEAETVRLMAGYACSGEIPEGWSTTGPQEFHGLANNLWPWVWRRFGGRGNAEMVTLHPPNGDPPWIMDFAIPGSSRPIMLKFVSQLKAALLLQ